MTDRSEKRYVSEQRSPTETATEVDIGSLIDQSAISALQIRIFVLCCLVAVLDGVDTFSIGVAAHSMAATLSIPLSSFGPVFSAALFGATLGAFAFGPLADRHGRKVLLVIAVLMFSVFTFATALAGSYSSLIAIRFLAGLGLGGATPCFLSLAAEYAPARMRATVTSALWAGFPLGGMIGSFMNGWLISHYQWQSLFYVGGLAPLFVALLIAAFVPESVRYLAARGRSDDRIGSVMCRIAPAPDRVVGRTKFITSDNPLSGAPVKYLFMGSRALGTPLLWVPFFMAFGVLTVVVLWTPALLQQAGMSAADSAFVVAIHGAGGFLGMAVAGRLFDRFGTTVLIPALLLGSLFTFLLGRVGVSIPLAATFEGLIGICVGIGASGVIALAAVVYPTLIRSAGIGWAMGMGRLGQVCLPLLVGALLTARWNVPAIFLVVAAGPVIAALVLPFVQRLFSQTELGVRHLKSMSIDADPIEGRSA